MGSYIMKAITIIAILFLYLVVGAGMAMATTPDTAIIIKPSDYSTSNSASFTFHSTIPESTFRCKLDNEEYKECKSGKIDYSGLQYGTHTFFVKAKKDGKYDLSPATHTWIVQVNKPDSDDDGLSDEDEDKYKTDKHDSDSDNDGVDDGHEIEHGSNPNDSDSDCDGVNDGDEDKDGDGERDGDEVGDREDGGIDDSDSDNLDDEFEDENDRESDNKKLKKDNKDSDGDNQNDDAEDNDNDGLTNKQEHDLGTNPNEGDNDHDGLTDKQEHDLGTDPNDKDSDDDGRTDKEEHDCGTNPNKPDSDDDGVNDGDEHEDGTDPKDPSNHKDGDDAPHNKHQNKCAMSLTKSADPLIYLYVGEIINYTYVINNTGNVNLTRPFNISDNKTTVTCPSAPTNLTSGANISCTASYVVTQDDLNNGLITNIANATAYFNSHKVTSNQATATVTMQGGGQIPEFPTVALPIAAVIGMVFLFQRRKNKE